MKNNRERKPERKRINIRLDEPVFDELQDLNNGSVANIMILITLSAQPDRLRR